MGGGSSVVVENPPEDVDPTELERQAQPESNSLLDAMGGRNQIEENIEENNARSDPAVLE